MCSVSEKSKSNAPYSIESASCDYRQGHWGITRSGYITTERDGYFGEFAAGKPHDLNCSRGLDAILMSRCREQFGGGGTKPDSYFPPVAKASFQCSHVPR